MTTITVTTVTGNRVAKKRGGRSGVVSKPVGKLSAGVNGNAVIITAGGNSAA